MKYVIGAGVFGVIFGQAQDVLEWVILISGAIIALGVIHTKAIRPAVMFAARTSRGVDILLELPETTAELHRRYERIDGRLTRVEEHLHLQPRADEAA